MPRASILLPACLLWLSVAGVGCSENFGSPPDPDAPGVGVIESGFAGPLEPLRVPRLLRGDDRLLFLAMDQRGIYRLQPDGPRWLPGPDRLGSRETLLLASDRPAQRWVASDGANLLSSVDGGELFDTLSSPSPSSRVEFLGVLPSSPIHPEGAWLVVVGVAAHMRPIGSSSWTPVDLPAVPLGTLCFDADEAGRALLGVRLEAGFAVWQSADGGQSFQLAGSFDDQPLALALFSGARRAVVHAAGLRVDGVEQSGLPPDGIDAAGLRGDASGFELFLHRGGELWWGRGPAMSWSSISPPQALRPEAGLIAVAGGGMLIAEDRSVLRVQAGSIRSIPFGGVHLDMGVVAADPRTPGTVHLAGGPRGEVWEGPAQGPWQSLGVPGQPARTALLADPLVTGALFSAGFGVQYLPAGGSSWEDRDEGQSSYACDLGFRGPVVVQTLAARRNPVEEIWLGSINGDGPYRSRDAGRTWQPIHEGLGPVGNCLESSGLMGITQARSFVFDGNAVFMAGFQGGVWELDEDRLIWSQRNEGLPDVFGDAVDSCCFDPLVNSVDVREMVSLDDGTLLAATGWGIHRLDPGARAWVPSNEGLSNFDVYKLVPLPGDSSFVLAGCSGKLDAPRWLFLSQDGGRSWATVGTTLLARKVNHLVWSDPSRLEAVALLDWSGAWRLRLDP